MSNYYSDCCGASPKGNGDNDSRDYGICPRCGEHCEFLEEDDESVLNDTEEERQERNYGIEN